MGPDGTISVPAFDWPMPSAVSEQVRKGLIAWASSGRSGLPSFEGISNEAEFAAYVNAYRDEVDGFIGPTSEIVAGRFPVELEPAVMGGVPVEDIRGPNSDERSVLINLHGGAFIAGAKYHGRIESIPLAHLGNFRVVAVNYRQAHEHKFPAASEDVAAVYQSLLEEYPPSRIGIFGGSAGGALTAQAIAWFIEKGLPVPAVAGIFSSGGADTDGDSKYFSAMAGSKPIPSPDRDPVSETIRNRFSYLSEVTTEDPLAFPLYAQPEVHAQYPPTMFLTGTRAFDLSPTIAFHRALVRAKVAASLHVFEGMGHCFYYGGLSAEALDAHETMIRFFRQHLGDVAEP